MRHDGEPQGTTISVIVPAHNAAQTLVPCLRALSASTYPHYECIVIDDGSTDRTPAIAAMFPVRMVGLPGAARGAAYARNRGAEVARGDILLFVDADVVVTPNTLRQVVEAFAARPSVAAVFGSYDDSLEPEFLSQYKNLSHHFVHQQDREEAATFWSGCGAIRSTIFFEIGGFDEDRQPWTCEDIELGYRLRAAGHAIRIDKHIQARHLKRWTLGELLRSDIFDRGIPWTRLILERRAWPDHLNLRRVHEVCALLLCGVLLAGLILVPPPQLGVLAVLAGLFLAVTGSWSDQSPHFRMDRGTGACTALCGGAVVGLASWQGPAVLLCFPGLVAAGLLADHVPIGGRRARSTALFDAIVLTFLAGLAVLPFAFSRRFGALLWLGVGAIVVLNRPLYAFFARRRGVCFALAVIPFQLLYYLYSLAAFALGVGHHVRATWRARRARSHCHHSANGGDPSPHPVRQWVNRRPMQS
jgi:glycosyltransferase involved in cell wall biosynthesis